MGSTSEIIVLRMTLEEAGSLLELLTTNTKPEGLSQYGPAKFKDFEAIQQTLVETLNTF